MPLPDADERRFEMSITLPADAPTIWKAITDAQELVRWFPLEARVRPGVGGEIWLSWGAGAQGTAPIEIFDPPRHFRWVENLAKPWSGGPTEGAGPWRVTVDFQMEPAVGGGTSLRVEQAGFGKGQGWDDDLDSISHGWNAELRSLRHYLGKHFGRERHVGWQRGKFQGEPLEVWQRLFGSAGLGAPPNLESLAEGSDYALIVPGGAELRGKVLLNDPPRQFIATVTNLHDSFLRIMVEYSGGVCRPYVWLASWGEVDPAATQTNEQLATMIRSLFST